MFADTIKNDIPIEKTKQTQHHLNWQSIVFWGAVMGLVVIAIGPGLSAGALAPLGQVAFRVECIEPAPIRADAVVRADGRSLDRAVAVGVPAIALRASAGYFAIAVIADVCRSSVSRLLGQTVPGVENIRVRRERGARAILMHQAV